MSFPKTNISEFLKILAFNKLNVDLLLSVFHIVRGTCLPYSWGIRSPVQSLFLTMDGTP